MFFYLIFDENCLHCVAKFEQKQYIRWLRLRIPFKIKKKKTENKQHENL